MIRWWIALWDRREAPLSMALVRILLGLVVVWDLVLLLRLDLAVALAAPEEAGGISDALKMKAIPLLYAWLPAEPWMGTAVIWTCLLAAIAFTAGFFTRAAGLVLVLVWAQWAMGLPASDRGIDMLVRDVVLLLVFSQSHRTLSVDARLRSGSWLGDGRLVPAWPRYLILLQLVVVYLAAGISKVSSVWTPFGGYTALFLAMNDPAFQRLDPKLIAAVYPLTQLLTATTWLWEWSAPTLLLALHYRLTRDRPGRLRAAMNRVPYVPIWLGIGAIFHFGTHLTLQLGIFPFAMMSLYPSAFHPNALQGAWGRIRRGRTVSG